MRLFQYRRDRWAIPDHTYECTYRCGFLFQLRDGSWYCNTDVGTYPDRWRKVGTWQDLVDNYGDCSASIERLYAGRLSTVNRTRARWYRGHRICFCNNLSQHIHWRGQRYYA
jgi:hypothetical protein